MLKGRNDEFDLEQAARFFPACQGMYSSQPLEKEDPMVEWRNFFSLWDLLPPAEVASTKKLPLDCESFKTFEREFTDAYEAYRSSGAMSNVWRTAGLGHDELRNSQVLSWILDKFGDHGQGSAILEDIVKLLGRQSQIQVTADNIHNNSYWTRTESLPLGDIESRVDIEIESSAFLIFIEVKVQAPETGDQLKRYVDLAPNKAAGRPWAVIYLTTEGRLPDNDDLHGVIIPLSWKQIAKILDDHTSGDLGKSFSYHIFRQFADHVRHLA